MANTYTQIHIHAVFAVQFRAAMIDSKWESELFKYMTGIFRNHNHKLLAINGVEDHVHIFFGMRPTQSLSDLMQDVKSASSKWVNDAGLTSSRFQWQQGFGAFSYAPSEISKVCRYIENQKLHHAKVAFSQEYKEILTKFDVSFDDRFIFKEPE